MDLQKRRVACFCENSFEVDLPQSADLGVDPLVEEQILKGDFMAVTCPSCGKRLTPEFPFHLVGRGSPSRPQGWDLFLVPEEDRIPFLRGKLEYSPGDPTRVVIGYPELAEKVLIFGQGLDDRVIEIMKYYLLTGAAARAEAEADPALLLPRAGGGTTRVPRLWVEKRGGSGGAARSGAVPEDRGRRRAAGARGAVQRVLRSALGVPAKGLRGTAVIRRLLALLGAALLIACPTFPTGTAETGVRSVVTTGHTGVVLGLRYDASRHLLFSSGDDGTVRVWDVDSGGLAHCLQVTRSNTRAMAIDSSSTRLAVVVTDGTRSFALSVWDWNEERQLYRVPLSEEPQFLRFSPKGTYLLYGTSSWQGLHHSGFLRRIAPSFSSGRVRHRGLRQRQ